MSTSLENAVLATVAALVLAVATGAIHAAEAAESEPVALQPTIDTDKDGKPDAWDRNSDGTADAWDANGDGKPDRFDHNRDGKPD
ncbi:MAG: hypothetical protein R3E09_19400 [Novosphingobium sp.]|nr:hypothetical protein [Novosphingobium sp.]